MNEHVPVCACVRVFVSVYALSGVTPLSQVLKKKHVEVKQCSSALVFASESNGGHLTLFGVSQCCPWLLAFS